MWQDFFLHCAGEDARRIEVMRQLTRPGGRILLQGYTPKQLDYKTGGPPLASHMYTETMLREAFASMEIDKLQEYEAMVQEGQGHHGLSALVGMVARKGR